MAIDFFVMPFSRYVAGDYVTPAMRFAWQQGVPYAIFGPGGTRELPRDLPFGGVDAAARRHSILSMIDEDLRALPAPIADSLWDERTDVEPRFHRVDPASYAALLDEARRNGQRSHASAEMFLPCEFEQPLRMASPFERVAGSAPRAIRELAAPTWSKETNSARDTLLAALEDARTLRLPMFVDA